MLTTLLEEIATALAGVGVKATHDARKLPVPGVLLYPAGLDFDRLDDSVATVEVDVMLVAKGNAAPVALVELEDMLTRIRQLWPVNQVRAVNLTLPNHSPDPLPGFSFTLTTEVTTQE